MNPQSQTRRPQRATKSCRRCHRRKQRCQGFPVCNNCQAAAQPCVQSQTAIEYHRNGPGQAAFERISSLEAQLSAAMAHLSRLVESPERNEQFGEGTMNDEYRGSPASTVTANPGPRPDPDHTTDHLAKNKKASYEGISAEHRQSISSPGYSQAESTRGHISDVVGFLSLGDSVGVGEPTYIGSSSGFSLAINLEQMVQATVWTKALASTVSETQPRALSIEDLKGSSAEPPGPDVGKRIIDAYFKKMHVRYPFLDPSDVWNLHEMRFQQQGTSPQDQYNVFKLYMVYAIGSTMLQLTESYEYTAPEQFFMKALQYISAARESHSIHNIEAMTLLVLYNLRSPSNSGIWYMVGLAMRSAVDLGLHREAHYTKLSAYQTQLRRRLFWSIYYLERVVALSLGRPFSISDRDIDASLPHDIDDSVHDDDIILEAITRSTIPRSPSSLTMSICLTSLKRVESQIQCEIYRVDKSVSQLTPEIGPLLKQLDCWKHALPEMTTSDTNYLFLQWNKAVRLLLQPFLPILNPNDKLIGICLKASGQICELFKRLHQSAAYGHSFIAVHSIFIAGLTMCYCLFISPSLYSLSVANDLRACTAALFVMAERTPVVKKYRDVLETVITSAMEFISRSPVHTNSSFHDQHSGDHRETNRMFSKDDHQVVLSLLGLSAQQAPDQNQIPKSLATSPQTGNFPPPATSIAGHQRVSFESVQNSSMNAEFSIASNPYVRGGNREWDLGLGEPYLAEEWGQNLWEGDRFSFQMLNQMMTLDTST